MWHTSSIAPYTSAGIVISARSSHSVLFTRSTSSMHESVQLPVGSSTPLMFTVPIELRHASPFSTACSARPTQLEPHAVPTMSRTIA